jgi:hypothetical protein
MAYTEIDKCERGIKHAGPLVHTHTPHHHTHTHTHIRVRERSEQARPLEEVSPFAVSLFFFNKGRDRREKQGGRRKGRGRKGGREGGKQGGGERVIRLSHHVRVRKRERLSA